jgi:hypothetical protein
MQTLFISYSRHDSNITLTIADRLRQSGHTVWTDVGGIPGGAVWLYEIEEAITNCETLVVMISQGSKDSQWVRREILYALDLKKRIIPIRIEDTTLPFALYDLQPIDHFSDPLKAIESLLGLLGQAKAPGTHQSTSEATTKPEQLDGLSLVDFRRYLLADDSEVYVP